MWKFCPIGWNLSEYLEQHPSVAMCEHTVVFFVTRAVRVYYTCVVHVDVIVLHFPDSPFENQKPTQNSKNQQKHNKRTIYTKFKTFNIII